MRRTSTLPRMKPTARCSALLPDAAARGRRVKGEFVSGCDIDRGMLKAGELTAVFDEKGVAYDKTKLTA